MPGRAELHFHLLPGVDDGPADMDETVELARLALRDGTSTVVATPHVCDVVPSELPARVEEVSRRLAELSLDLEVLCGGEIAFGDVQGLTRADLEVMAHGPPGARWVLLEAPLPETGASADDLATAARAIGEQGYGVVLGHPERSPALFEEGMTGLREQLAAGAVPQINATSLLGAHGEEAERRAFELAAACPSAIVASDAHRPTRGPALRAAAAALVAGGIEEPVARAMVGSRPRRLLTDGLPAVSSRAAGREPASTPR